MSPTTVSVFAPAKVNLTLHVTGQRTDGYHFLDSLVAFASVGDHLRITPCNALSLTVAGPESGSVPAGFDNLALRAAALLNPKAESQIALEKLLPSASGIGGGSADAAAAYRGFQTFLDPAEGDAWLGDHDVLQPSIASDQLLALGADIPMCLMSRPARVGGIGEQVEFIELPPLSAVLVNPRVPVSTPAVFLELTEKDSSPMPGVLPSFSDSAALIDWLQSQRNDLEAPALRIAPAIGDVLEALRATGDCSLARMSGSGATCFGLYSTASSANAAVEDLRQHYPGWWIAGCELGDQSDAARPRIN